VSVTLTDVVVAYGDHVAVDHLSLEIAPRKLTALLGPSGCGKTSLLRAICGLEPIAAGSIRIGGRLVAGDGLSVAPEKRRIGLVFQQGALFPHMTVWKNVLFGLRGVGGEEDRAEAALRLVQMFDLRRRYPDQLSGGEQQRISLARALVTQPAILLADEPTGNLDSKNGTAIMELLRKSCDDLEQTTVVVTHDAKASAYADRVIFLRDGKVQKELLFHTEQPLANKVRAIIETLETLE
jgi:ABC-type Fe3+/spermidine/putrescine transport system ATPase subunit